MPPLDWSIVQSLLLTIVLPSCGVAAGVLAVVFAMTRSETRRSMGASLAFVAGLGAGNLVPGLAAKNFSGELVPFFAIHRVADQLEQDGGAVGRAILSAWEIETGWYSLFSVTLVAVLAEIVIDGALRQHSHFRWALLARGVIAIVSAIWLTPWGLLSTRPWVGSLLAAVILLNTTTLRVVGQSKQGHFVPMILAVAWGGSAATVLVLAHSARFADLAIVLSCALAGVGLLILLYRLRSTSLYSGPATYLPGLMLGGYLNTYSQIPAVSFGLMAIAPGLLVLLHGDTLRRWFEARPIALLATFLIPCVLAVGLAIRAEF